MNCPACQSVNEPEASSCTSCGTLLLTKASGASPIATTVSETVSPESFVVSVDLRPGSLFHSRYEIQALLGRGGMGMVYKAHDRALDETVAIKILRPDFAQNARMAERFKSEIKLARRVRHRNVCAIHDYDQDAGLFYISMEFIEGVDLKRVLKERGALPAEEAFDLAIQLAEGLQAVHDAGIIHRDLKTPNIMRDARGVARLMDFGVAKRHGAEGTVTATGQIVGTPEYMSPEQAQGQRLDYRCDIYALGIVIYEMFTGQVPFRGDTPISTILKHLNDPPPLEGPLAARIPPALKAVLRRALAKNPAHRYQSAREMAEALRRARTSSGRQPPVGTAVLEAPTLESAPQRVIRRAAGPLLIVLAVAILAGILMLRRSVPSGTGEDSATADPSQNRALRPLPAASGSPPPLVSDKEATAASAAPRPSPAEASSGSSVGSPPPASGTSATTLTPAKPRESAALTRSPSPTVRSSAPSPLRARSPSPTPPIPAAEPESRTVPSPVALSSASPSSPSPPPTPSATPAPRAESVAEGPGLLLVAVIPWGEVSLDGKVLGMTPIDKISLSAGTHSLRVRHPAYEAVELKVTIRAGQTEKVIVNLPEVGVPRRR